MRTLLSEIFRLFFKLSFFKKRFFGIYKRLIFPFNLFKGVRRKFLFKNSITFELHIEDWIQQNLFFLGEYETHELCFIEKTLRYGDVFIDIGANIGLYTLFASKLVGKDGKVISFEPYLMNFNLLKRNVSLNYSENLVLEKLAIFQTETQISMFYDTKEANQGMASSYLTEYSCSEIVDTISLDLYLSNQIFKSIDLIKIDIEGGEYPALLGMKETLIKYNPKLLIEIDNEILLNTPYTEQHIIHYLNDLGYKKYFLDYNGEISEKEIDNKLKNYVFIK